MNLISSYILSLCGISVVGLIAEFVLPKGKMVGVVKTSIGILTIIIFLNIVLRIDFSSLSFNFAVTDNVDAGYVQTYNEQKIKALKSDVEKSILESGFENVLVEFNVDERGNILEAFVDLKNVVILNKSANINKYTNIVEIIKSFVNIRKEKIFFNE